MTRNTRRTQRGHPSLSRERIIDAAIAMLDRDGIKGLTFRALAEALETGAGAIYWHVADKDDLVNAACDALVARTLGEAAQGAAPQQEIRAAALGMYDAIDAHPWVGAALTHSPGAMPMVRVLESLGAPLAALGVAPRRQWLAATSLLHYVLGVAGQNAANAQRARELGLVREASLDALAGTWSGLDAQAFPFTRAMAAYMRDHDDRSDFLAGLDLILAGILAEKAA